MNSTSKRKSALVIAVSSRFVRRCDGVRRVCSARWPAAFYGNYVVLLMTVAALSACTPSVDKDKFKNVYRSSQTMQSATSVGVNYLQFGELVRDFATEVRIANGDVSNKPEKQMVEEYSSALSAYEMSLQAWATKNKVGDMPPFSNRAENLLQFDWCVAKEAAQRGDAIYLKRSPPESKDCRARLGEHLDSASAAITAASTSAAAGSYTYDVAKGKELFTANCSACHQATGEGIPGAFPPLKGNAAVDNADPTLHLDTILHGAQGVVVGGVKYTSAMPPFAGQLNDADIANIANYERTSWGNHAKPVTPAEVAAQRAKGK